MPASPVRCKIARNVNTVPLAQTVRSAEGHSTALGHLSWKKLSPALTARATACPDLAPGRTPQHPCPQTLSARMDWCLQAPTAAGRLHTPEPAQAKQSGHEAPGQRSMVAWESATDKHCRLGLARVRRVACQCCAGKVLQEAGRGSVRGEGPRLAAQSFPKGCAAPQASTGPFAWSCPAQRITGRQDSSGFQSLHLISPTQGTKSLSRFLLSETAAEHGPTFQISAMSPGCSCSSSCLVSATWATSKLSGSAAPAAGPENACMGIQDMDANFARWTMVKNRGFD